MLVYDWLIQVRCKGREEGGGATEAANAKSNKFFFLMTEAGQSSVTFPAGRNQPIRGCSIGNLKQTEQNEVNEMEGDGKMKGDEAEGENGKKERKRFTGNNRVGVFYSNTPRPRLQ